MLDILPNIYLFNPTCDIASANNTVSYKPNRLLSNFENDLAFLPNYLAEPKDVILMPEYEDLSFVDFLYRLGFKIAGQILQKDLEQPQQKILANIDRFAPWGWAPNIIHRLKKIEGLKSSCPLPEWNDAIRNSLSRDTSRKVLSNILAQDRPDMYISPLDIPKKLTDLESIEKFVQQHYPVVLKEPWSSSARGNIILRKPFINGSLKQRILSVIKKQGFLMGEKWYDKLSDFSLHFKADKGHFHFQGTSFFQTDSNGQYQSSYIRQMPDLNNSALAFLSENLPQIENDVSIALNKNRDFDWYIGNMGVDLMLIQTTQGLRVHPCVEINLRNTMGTVALSLEKQIHPEAKGQFEIFFHPQKTFSSWFQDEQSSYQTSDNQLIKGKIPLICPSGKQWGAMLNLD